MSLATEKDEVLTRLKSEETELNLAHYDFTYGDQKEFGDLFYSHKNELVLEGYIRCYPDIEGAIVDSLSVRILPKGLVFLNNGGYSLIEQKEQVEAERKVREWRWKRRYEIATLGVAVIAFMLSAVTFCSTPRRNQIEELKQGIDSLRQRLNRIDRLKINARSKSKVEVTSPASRTNTK